MTTTEVASHVPALVAYPLECAVAITAAGLVAPLISIIDKAIFSNASGKEKLGASIVNSLRLMLTSPGAFFRAPSFRWIWLVYGGTYCTANTVDVFCRRSQASPVMPVFVATSGANVGLSLLKDKAFQRMFAVVAPKPLPAASYALFATRDSMTILASFTMTSRVSQHLQETFDLSKTSADVVTQLTLPISMQLFSTPLHLVGMDLYNNPGNPQRGAFVRREYLVTAAARMGRIFPAFGIGGLTNKLLRKQVAHWQDHHFSAATATTN